MDKSQLHIILADDDEGDRADFIDALAEMKLQATILTFSDGAELMEHLSSEEYIPPPLLLFLDLNMPCKDGLQCLKEIRSIKKFKEVVVAVYSTSSSEDNIKATFSNGANVYIKKPNDFSVLKKALSKLIASAQMYKGPPAAIENFLFRM